MSTTFGGIVCVIQQQSMNWKSSHAKNNLCFTNTEHLLTAENGNIELWDSAMCNRTLVYGRS